MPEILDIFYELEEILEKYELAINTVSVRHYKPHFI
jgi:hypothetical protein